MSRFHHTVNQIGQRETLVTSGSAYSGTNRGWTWGYDALGQLTAAANTADSELDRSYLFDAIGNRLQSIAGDTTSVTTVYLYDGWNVIAEDSLHPSTFTPPTPGASISPAPSKAPAA